MKTKGVIIQAIARIGGNSSIIMSYVNKKFGFDVFNLNEYNIAHYKYAPLILTKQFPLKCS